MMTWDYDADDGDGDGDGDENDVDDCEPLGRLCWSPLLPRGSCQRATHGLHLVSLSLFLVKAILVTLKC